MYASPPPEIKDILHQLRRLTSVDVCPMCGSFNNCGTLEHVFPKNQFEEYSIYTKNLVPSCQCNSLRGVVSVGPIAGQRILHPYFDDLVSERLFQATFKGNFPTIQIDVEVCYKGSGKRAVIFHLENVLKKNYIIDYLIKAPWAKLLRMPDDILKNFPDVEMTPRDLTQCLKATLDQHDRKFGTPNNWDSIMFSGILTSKPAREYLLSHLNGIINGSIKPEEI